MDRQLKQLVCIALVATLSLTGCRNNEPAVPSDDDSSTSGGSATKLSSQEFQKAVRLWNRGLGFIENKAWSEAEQALSDVAKMMPQSISAQRNLAISRVLAIVDGASSLTRSGPPANAQKYVAAVAAARTAIAAYRDAASAVYDKALADLLEGRLLVHSDSPDLPTFEQGLSLLRGAAEQVPAAADFRFAVAMAMDGSNDYSNPDAPESAELLQALQQSFELAPENLFALQKLLQRQALCLNSKNPTTKERALQVTDTLQAATQLLAPLNESIRKQRRIDLVEMISKAIEAFDGTNPSALMVPALQTGNLLLPEIATQIDQRRLNRNLLEYLVPEFDPTDQPSIDASSVAAPKTVITGFQAGTALPAMSGVTKTQMLDFNLDGRDDLIVLRDGRFEVYSSDGTSWQQLVAAPADTGATTDFLLADIDRDYDKAISELRAPLMLLDPDGDRRIVEDPAGKNRWFDADYDVILWGDTGVKVLRNERQSDGSRMLTAVPQEEDVTDVNDAVAADLDADGDLDLAFATSEGIILWQNSDGSIFVRHNAGASLPQAAVATLTVCDWDRNIAMDLIGVSEADGRSGLVQNILHNRYRWVESDTGLGAVPAGSAVIVDQLDGRGSWDLVTAGDAGLNVFLTRISDGSNVTILPATTLSTAPMLGARIADLDNDGRSDIVAWSDDGLLFFRSTGAGTFEDLSDMFPQAAGVTDLILNDVDEDGDLDVVYAATHDGAEGVPQVLLNEGGHSNHWISVVARGKPDDDQFRSNRVNAHATGAVIEVRCGDRYQAHLISDAKIHIGLGDCDKPDSIRIIWTDGIPQNVMTDNLLRPRVGILAPQILLGSCPYIYTWTGERFEFFSDCLWAAPLGLVQANGEIAPTREWENLLIPGEALVQRQESCVLQLTEELWETAYFDQVQLTAIDHPTDVRIFTNEKVGPPDLAAHRIHTVKTPHSPASVVDGRGVDLLPGLTEQDGDYVQAFTGRIVQGLTDEWVMEIDLGPLPDRQTAESQPDGDSGRTPPRDIRLFLIGWIFPTDTSLNLGIEQNPHLAPPSPPSIEVPDGAGGWKVARPFIGFPSGKTKAMVVNISDIFVEDDYRFRIRSSMELYWDQVFFTVDELDAETVVQPCELLTGHLHYRGFSRRTYGNNALFRNGRAPEGYDYESVTTDPRWPPIGGRFTRYGDTTPLLFEHDDQMVVMGPGDELTIEFAAPTKPVPAGWKRDFVLRNIGYDKDANLNTIYGQSSEPFPFRGMSRYPFSPDEQGPDSPRYRRYLEEWQTRTYSIKPFWNVLQQHQDEEVLNP